MENTVINFSEPQTNLTHRHYVNTFKFIRENPGQIKRVTPEIHHIWQELKGDLGAVLFYCVRYGYSLRESLDWVAPDMHNLAGLVHIVDYCKKVNPTWARMIAAKNNKVEWVRDNYERFDNPTSEMLEEPFKAKTEKQRARLDVYYYSPKDEYVKFHKAEIKEITTEWLKGKNTTFLAKEYAITPASKVHRWIWCCLRNANKELLNELIKTSISANADVVIWNVMKEMEETKVFHERLRKCAGAFTENF